MALDVIVQITQTAIAGKTGFGTPLILTTGSQTAVPFTICNSITEVRTACGASSEAQKAATLIFAQANKPAQIAVYSTTATGVAAIAEVISKDWRQLILIRDSSDTSTDVDIATYIEETNKQYFITVSTTAALAGLSSFSRTIALFSTTPYAVAALVGETAGREAGSFTYKNLILKGVLPLVVSDNELAEIHAAGALTVVKKAGDIVTSEGKTCSGEFIDIIDSIDWIKLRIATDTQDMLNKSDKLPYTDTGIAALENVTTNVLQEAFTRGMIAASEDETTPLYTVSFKRRSEMSAEDRATRTYSGGNFEFTLAGAIHTATIKGELLI